MRKHDTDSFLSIELDDAAWLTQDGQILLIDEMTMTHLINTIELIKEKNKRLDNMITRPYVIPARMLQRLEDMKENYPEYFI